jgi:hypothetical protein
VTTTRVLATRPWFVAGLLTPIFFVLAIIAAIVAGDSSDSFFVGLLAFLVTLRIGRVIRRLVRNRPLDALYQAIWPAAAIVYAYLFAGLGSLPDWAAVLLALLLAGPTRRIVDRAFLPRRTRPPQQWLLRFEEWGLPAPDDVIPGRWTRKG